MGSLLIVERMILESIDTCGKDIKELAKDTDLNPSLVRGIVNSFIEKGLIVYKEGKYLLNGSERSNIINQVNAKENLREEIKDIFNTMVNSTFEQSESKPKQLKLQKLWLSQNDEKIFETLVGNLENFVEGIKRKNTDLKRSQKIAEGKVIFWGHSSYSDLAHQSIAYA